jgi:bla regulator protein blaR1
MIPESLSPVANHLWQSTLFAGVAGLVALALQQNSARVRHWIWVAALLKFLVPFSILMRVGSLVQLQPVWVPPPTDLPIALYQASQPFTTPTIPSPFVATVPPPASLVPALLSAVWGCGFMGISVSWWLRWRRISAAVRAGSAVELGLPIRAISSPSFLEPGIFGVLRPVLLLPDGVFDHLTPEQWKSVVAHELCHVRHRDNFIGLLQMFVEAVFWFHPVVWWIGGQILQERESACDEEVLRLGNEPRTYAQGILKICELYLESPVSCLTGVSGSNLRKRIEAITAHLVVQRPSWGKKLVITAAGASAVMVPVAIGVMNAPYVKAQVPLPIAITAPGPQFDVASVKPNKSQTGVDRIRNANGAFLLENVSLKRIIGMAYGVDEGRDYLFFGPRWLEDENFDIEARYPPGTSENDVLRMLQGLLSERFHLQVHRDSKVFSAYALVTSKGGTKIRAKTLGPNERPVPKRRTLPGQFSASSITLAMFADSLSQPAFQLDRPVVDFTGLAGYFDITLEWMPVSAADTPTNGADAASIFTALEEQLGLKLEARKIPLSVLVIDSVDRVPSPN